MIVNLNTICKVKLNELGKVIWISQIDQIPEDIKKTRPDLLEHIKNQIDSEGILEAELWTIMNIFGQYVSPSSMPFSTATIELDKNPRFNPS